MTYVAGIPYRTPPTRKKIMNTTDPQCASLKNTGCNIALKNQNAAMKTNRLFPRGVISSSALCIKEI